MSLIIPGTMRRREFVKRLGIGALGLPAVTQGVPIINSYRFAAGTPGNGLLNNLLAYYKFDGGTSASDATDSSGNGRTLTQASNPATATGLLFSARTTGSSARFSSTNSGFVFGDVDMTILGFFNPGSVAVTPVLCSRYDSGSTPAARSYRLSLGSSNVSFTLSPDGSATTVLTFTGLTIATSTWYFACIRYNHLTDLAEICVTPCSEPSTRSFQTTTHAGGFYSGGTQPFAMGASYSNGANLNGFTGTLDEWGVYSSVLTDTQVSQYYNAGVPLGYPAFTT